MLCSFFPRPLAVMAMHQLARVDYTVANRVTEDAARVVEWAYAHDLPMLARVTVEVLQRFDDFGSVLISMVVWLVCHTP